MTEKKLPGVTMWLHAQDKYVSVFKHNFISEAVERIVFEPAELRSLLTRCCEMAQEGGVVYVPTDSGRCTEMQFTYTTAEILKTLLGE